MCRYNYLIIRAPKRRACFSENMYVFLEKLLMFLRKHVRVFLWKIKRVRRIKKNFYNNSLLPHHVRKIVNIHKAEKSFPFFTVSQR